MATASSRLDATRDEQRRGSLAPKPAPRSSDVVVVAPEALALAAAEWHTRSELEQAAKARLQRRVAELERALRRAQTDVKRRRELPNNETFTRTLVEENHELLRRNRALESRLAHYQGRGRVVVAATAVTEDDKAQQGGRQTSLRQSQERPDQTTKTLAADQPAQSDEVNRSVETEKEEVKEASARAALSAVRPLIDALKKKLQSLETDLDRLGRENELLRAELGEAQNNHPKLTTASSDHHETSESTKIDLDARLQAQTKLLDILEIKYKSLKNKNQQQTHLYHDSLKRQEELSTQLLSAQQALGDYQHRLGLYSDQHALVEDLQNEVHMLRSENATLNDAVATLSSRPFDRLSKELQKKNLLIAELETEKSECERARDRAETDARAALHASDALRKRVKQKDDEIRSLVEHLDRQRLECERVQMEREVAQLQLRFYVAPPDKDLMLALGNAVRDLKRKEQLGESLAFAGRSIQNSNITPKADMTSSVDSDRSLDTK